MKQSNSTEFVFNEIIGSAENDDPISAFAQSLQIK